MKKAFLVFENIKSGLGWATIDYVMEFSGLELNTEKFILALLLAGDDRLFFDYDDDLETGTLKINSNDVLEYFSNIIKNS